MKKSESVPDSVWLAGLGIVGAQLVQLASLSFQAVELAGLGIAAVVALLLVRGTAVGWVLAVLWSVSEMTAPISFGSPILVAVVGLGVALALVMKSARGYCFRVGYGAVVREPVAVEQNISANVSKVAYDVAEGRPWREIQRRLSAAHISKKYAFVGFLIGTLVLLPATGLLLRLHRGSGRGDSLVDVSYHVVNAASTLTQVGLVVTIVLLVRAAVR